MPLEPGTYISDLVPTNPETNDPVSEGDDHIRLLKSTILNTFPNIDNEVLLSQDEINDAALQGRINTFTEPQEFSSTHLRLNGVNNELIIEAGLIFAQTALTDFDFAALSLGRARLINTAGAPANAPGTEFYSGFHFEHADADFATQFIFDSNASGEPSGFARQKSAGVFGPWMEFAFLEKRQVFTQGIILDNDTPLFGLDDTAGLHTLIGISPFNNVRVGDVLLNSVHEALAKHTFEIGGVASADVVDLLNGGLKVADRAGVLIKAGFRNPRSFVLGAGNVTLLQSYEGQIVESGTSSRSIEVPQLEQDTTMTVIWRAVTDNTLIEGAGVTLQWVDGSGTFETGTRDVAGASVVQLQWRTPTSVYVWGNGIT